MEEREVRKERGLEERTAENLILSFSERGMTWLKLHTSVHS